MRPRPFRPALLPSYALLLVLTVAACARVPEPGASEDPPAPDVAAEARAFHSAFYGIDLEAKAITKMLAKAGLA